MDTDAFGTGLLIAALTLGSVGIFLVGFGMAGASVTPGLLLSLGVLTVVAFLVWRRRDVAWYVMCSWTIPAVTLLVLLANASESPDLIRFLGILFVFAGAANLITLALLTRFTTS